MSRLSVERGADAPCGGYDTHATRLRDVSVREDEARGRRGRTSGTAERDGEGRRRRDRRSDQPMRGERRGGDQAPRAAEARAHVSAYVDESTVVGVTPRSERRAARYGGLTAVPPLAEPSPRYGTQPSWDGSYGWDDLPGWGDMPGWNNAPAWDDAPGWDEPYGGRSSRAARPPRRESRREAAVNRDWLYTGEDAREERGRPRGRSALVDILLAVPQLLLAAVGKVLGGALGLLAHVRGLFVLILAAIMAFMLYAPARELYVANRKLETLQATYDALLAENDEIRGDLELLQTREGIENEARSRGYVATGETKVVVEGLPEDVVPDGALEAVTPLELPDERPWYVLVLDKLFAYDPEG